MAKRRGQTPPSSQRLGDRVFPIVPIRRQLQANNGTVVAGLPVFETVDLQLDFETYEVYDIYRWESYIRFAVDELMLEATGADTVQVVAALLEVAPVASAAGPPQQTALNLLTEATWEGDSSVVTTHREVLVTETQEIGAVTTAIDFAQLWAIRYKSFDFIQPWTIASNPANYLVYSETAEDASIGAIVLNTTMWGRIRNATKEEFYAVNYRRFK